MENHVQNLELVDGEWVSRPRDIYQIMARARMQDDTEMREPESRLQIDNPRLGLLSRTVLPSPYVKFILPANIRRRRQNDLVFIGEDSVHLKEPHPNGPLRHVASTSGFAGRILAAKVFGEPRKAEVKVFTSPINRKDLHAQRRSTIGEEADILPPEIVVLTLDSRSLLFLWAHQTPAGTVTFRQKAIPLPAGASRFDQLGSFLAIDPNCRAIAVAASESQFILYKTKNVDKWREDIRAGRDSTPIEDERLIPIQGRIIHMDFLSSGAGQDDSHVVLLFVLAHGGRTKVTCFDWDARHNLSTAAVRVERSNVDAVDQNPSLLIPLSRSPDFLMVFDRHVTKNYNVLSGTIRRFPALINEHIPPSLHPGDTRIRPRWVQWNRVARNEDFPKESFYIAREDGKVLYVEVSITGTPTLEIEDAGQLPHAIDKAFASVDIDAGALSRLQPDVLVAAGTTSNGSLFKIGSWAGDYRNMPYTTNHSFAFIESLPSWVPVADLAVTRLQGISSPYERDRNSIFITNGRSPNGSVTELRRGLKALVDVWSPGMNGCTRLSIIDHGHVDIIANGKQTAKYHAVLLVNMPPESLVLRITRVDGQWNMEQISNDDESSPDSIIREETLSAGSLVNRFAVQITFKEARILSRPDLIQVDSLSFPNTLLAAASSPLLKIVAVSYREGDRPILQAYKVSESGTFGSRIHQFLPHDPTCIELMEIDGEPHIFLGTTDASIQVLRISDARLDMVCQCSLGENSAPQRMWTICESAMLMTDGDQRAIVCGTRDGLLANIALTSTVTGLQFAPVKRIKMGNTTVQVTPSATDSSVAFVACGTDFCRIRYNYSNNIELDSIWFADDEDESYQQSAIMAIDQLPLVQQEEDAELGLGGFMFAISGDRLLVARMDYEIGCSRLSNPGRGKTVPRRLALSETPSKLLYTEKLKKMIITATEPKEERGPPNGYRTMHSMLQILKLDEEGTEIKHEDELERLNNKFVAATFTLENYERVYAITEWVVLDPKNRPHHFVFVGTGITQGPGKEIGRRLFLQVVDSTIKQKKEKTYDAPVRCMALYDDTHLVTIVGKILTMEHYETSSAKWNKTRKLELPSEGIHLSVSRPFVYVSTAQHSHICYGVPDDDGPFKKVFSDSHQRHTAYHSVISLDVTASRLEEASSSTMDLDSTLAPTNRTTIVLLSDKSCNLAGLLHPPHAMNKSDPHTLFEAHLPRSITRIQRGDVRPPWRRPFSGNPSGVLMDDIIGTCVDGAVYSFSILSEPALKLLKLVQNLIKLKEARNPSNQYSTIRQGSGAVFSLLVHGSTADQSSSQRLIKVREVDPEHGKSTPKSCHVDADVILRFFDGDVMGRPLDQPDSLLGLLSVGVEREVGMRFAELASNAGFGYELGAEQELVETVGNWMRDVMLEVL